jgi:hypothetical protein
MLPPAIGFGIPQLRGNASLTYMFDAWVNLREAGSPEYPPDHPRLNSEECGTFQDSHQSTSSMIQPIAYMSAGRRDQDFAFLSRARAENSFTAVTHFRQVLKSEP